MGRFVVSLLLIVSIGFIGANSCSIQDSCEADYTVLKLYGEDNSHVARYDQTNFDQYLCCDFSSYNPHASRDGGINRVVGISSINNAHAQAPKESVYEEGVYFGTLECDSMADSCSAEYPIEMISLSGESNAHVADFSVYDLKVCCQRTCGEDGLCWMNPEGDIITEADLGDTVKLATINTDSATFEVKERDGSFPDYFDDDILNIPGASENSMAIGVWRILKEHLDETSDYDKFYFNILGDSGPESGELTISETEDDDPMEIEIISPSCGEYFSEGDNISIIIRASDPDDIITGKLRVNGDNVSFTNGGVSFNKLLDFSGDLQVVAEAVNSRNRRSRDVSNIMILEKSGNSYVDGMYVAACISEPEDFSSFDGKDVAFNASTTRGINVSGGNIYELIPGRDRFSWTWTFSHKGASESEKIVEKYLNSNERIDFEFIRTFAVAGDNSALLSVDL